MATTVSTPSAYQTLGTSLSEISVESSLLNTVPPQELFFKLFQALKPGGSLTVSLTENTQTQELFLAAARAGFVSISEEKEIQQLKLRKPNWQQGASVSLKDRKKNKQTTSTNNTASTPQNVWTLSANDIKEDDIEDDDQLLETDDLVSKPRDDCDLSNGARKACKNCTCGRAELEDQKVFEEKKKESPSNQCLWQLLFRRCLSMCQLSLYGKTGFQEGGSCPTGFG